MKSLLSILNEQENLSYVSGESISPLEDLQKVYRDRMLSTRSIKEER